jgi:hypothetical protein
MTTRYFSQYPWLNEDLIGSFAYAERYLNHDSNPTKNLPARYSPIAPESSFDIKAYKISHDSVIISTSNPSKPLLDYIVSPGEGWVSLFVHPDIVGFEGLDYSELLDNDTAITHKGFPTSSFRTIGILTGDNVNNKSFKNFYAVKVCYPRKISIWGTKSLGPRTMLQSVATSTYLMEFVHPKFGMFRETIGISFPTTNHKLNDLPNGSPDYSRPHIKKGWGMIVREMEPYPKAQTPTPAGDSEWHILPMFSIYSHDSNDLSRELVLEVLYRAYKAGGGEGSVIDYVMTNFIEPCILCMVKCLEKTGIFLMPHAQNVRFEIDSQFNIGRAIMQDWDTYVDLEKRISLNLPTKDIHPDNCFYNDPDRDPKEMYSYIYDSAIGNLTFLPLSIALDGVDWWKEDGNTLSAELERRISSYFGTVMPYHREVFPQYVYDTDHARMAAGNGRHMVSNTGKLPRWRPTW